MRCPECGFENPEGFKFCGSCGTELTLSCPNCGAPAQPGFRFCGECGHPLDAEAPPSPGERPMPSERRRVTVLFADLVGFSTLAEHMDPEELRTLMNETFKELTATIEERDGVVEKFIGDAVVAIFGAPVAHEDDPERAVHSALAMREILEERSRSLPSKLQIRIGVTGHARAAELYASLELPYEEARCRIGAGQLEGAQEIVDRYGLANGPLGALLDKEGLSAGR
ncbi:MAG: adenylate/guanylate cyclase domain-containing protein [Actinomycetota bacterium]